jgi:ketosteroid isomerase-like protein
MDADHSSPREILQVQEQFWRALQTKNASIFAAIIDQDFVARSPGEADQTREEFITTLITSPLSIGEITGEGIKVHLFGTVAVLTGVQVAHLSLPDGKVKRSRVMLSNVFRHQGQRWRLVLCHAFELLQDL